eukprot:TRINITY_DN3279_c0_g1_i1.p1 TRINITY_DN3279_c0_g1~~TRINITY_DN3279_c0_g1_i1.p1  ORF type:complete len:502 (+),score=111.38 TRINITY_DN3279_c0_g1_i1:58-1563(+)
MRRLVAVGLSRHSHCLSRRLIPAVYRSAVAARIMQSNHVLHSPHIRLFSSAASLPEHVKLAMPALSPTMKQGNLAAWHKKEGDKVSQGDVLADVETDKATVAFEAVEEGYLAKILVPAGSKDVPLGKVVAILVENEADISKFKDYSDTSSSSDQASAATPKSEEKQSPPTPSRAPSQPSPSPQPQPQPQKQTQTQTQAPSQQKAQPQQQTQADRVVASPLARKMASDKDIDLSQVSGTGPNRRIIRADLDEFQPSAAVGAGAGSAFRDLPLSNIRQVIAERLMQSKQTIPHYYLSSDINMKNIIKLRQELNQRLVDLAKKQQKEPVKLSLNDFVIKAAALACRKVPAANSSWMDSFIRQYDYVDMSIAVQTDQGLLAPVVRDADIRGLEAISRNVKDLAQRARINKLKPEEFVGGTFTVSNLGMFGVKQFSAIINPPQACILAVGSTEDHVRPASKSGEYITVPMMNVTLSCDHRVVDGAVGAQWIGVFKEFMENPSTMLL